MFLKLIK